MSYYDTILTSAKGVVQALTSFDTEVLCDVRKRPFVSTDHGDTLPACIFSPLKETIALKYMSNGVHVDYPVLVTLVQARGSLDNDAQRQWQSDRREEIRQALHKTGLSGASTVMACVAYDPDPVFDLQGLDEVFDVSCQVFTFRSNEVRSV